MHFFIFPAEFNLFFFCNNHIFPTEISFDDICVWILRQLSVRATWSLERHYYSEPHRKITFHITNWQITLLVVSYYEWCIKGCGSAWAFFFFFSLNYVTLFVPPSDVFFMSPTGCYYRLWCEDVQEDVSLLLRCEGQSPDQRESLTGDLPVSQFAFGLFCTFIYNKWR